MHFKAIFDDASRTMIRIANSDIMLETFLQVVEGQPDLVEPALPWARQLVVDGSGSRTDQMIAAAQKLPAQHALSALRLLSVCQDYDVQALIDGVDRGEFARRLVRTVSAAVAIYSRVSPDQQNPILKDALQSIFYSVAQATPILPSQRETLGQGFEQNLAAHPELGYMASNWAKTLAVGRESEKVMTAAQALSSSYPEVSLNFITSVVNADLDKVREGSQNIDTTITRLNQALTMSSTIFKGAGDDMQSKIRLDVFDLIKRVYTAIPKYPRHAEQLKQLATEYVQTDPLLKEAFARLAKPSAV